MFIGAFPAKESFNEGYSEIKSRNRETPAAPKLPVFLCSCFLVKGLGNFKPTDEADGDLFFGVCE